MVFLKELFLGLLIIVAIMGIIDKFLLRRFMDRAYLRKTIILAVLLRFAVALILFHVSLSKGGNGNWLGFDDELYLQTGRFFSDVFMSSGKLLFFSEELFLTRWNLYYFINGISWTLFGDNALRALLMLNVIVGSLIILPVYNIGKLICGRRAARISVFLVAVYPRLILWSSMNYRDVYLALFVTIAAWGLVSFLNNRRFWARWAILGVAGVCAFRFPMGVLLAGVSGFVISISSLKRPRHGRYILVGIACALLTIIYFYRNSFPIIRSMLGESSASTNQLIESSAGSLAGSLAGNEATLEPIKVIIGMGTALVWPIPLSRPDAIELMRLEGIFNLAWYGLMPFWVYGIFYFLKHKLSTTWALFLIMLLGWISASISAFGTLNRSLYSVQPIFMTLIAAGILAYHGARTKIALPILSVPIMICMLYALLRSADPWKVIVAMMIPIAMTILLIMWPLRLRRTEHG